MSHGKWLAFYGAGVRESPTRGKFLAMPRGRHRHSPPLHRLLPPSAIAGVSVVCALGPWVFSEATVLRALAAAAAVTAVVGAVVMRRWDVQAGRQVADLTRARAGDEWRFEERVAELETDLEESRELRTKLEQRLRAKRAELAGLRNEHASLLRRYATAETERASALEGRRLLEIEAAEPSTSPALPPARSAGRGALEAAPKTVKDGESAEDTKDVENAGDTEAGGASSEEGGGSPASGDGPKANAVFSPEGSWLYQRALLALAGFDGDAPADDSEAEAAGSRTAVPETESAVSEEEAADDGAAEPEPAAADASGADASGSETSGPEAPKGGTAEAGPVAKGVTEGVAAGEGAEDGVTDHSAAPRSEDGAPAALEDGEPGQHATDGDHARAAADPTAQVLPAKSAGQPQSGHFTVPTAVAVVPAAPARRQVVEGGFDFFGTQKGEPKAALDSVQNEDLADVVGQEALAVHKAEAEAEFKPAGPNSLGAGQVIDLTEHDETEQIDVQGLRSAAS
ncbi:hypothetical protein SAMN05428944_4363 [Streptomyces sp. 1222.5]|nr:hypothetical protein BX260_3734 [Streptomyces sp. 5112.2]SEC60719.1 hypothetical protein SAMN05428944_4363 [Streptomyces sp. 1222.5]